MGQVKKDPEKNCWDIKLPNINDYVPKITNINNIVPNNL